MDLLTLIVERIQAEGCISFHDYMDMVLYYPGLGYYTSEKEKTGIYGDYYTSPHCTSLFGEMIGKQIEEMWNILGKTNFAIVEFGAGNGILANDILNYLKHNKEFYDYIHYYVIEKNHLLKPLYAKSLDEKVLWVESINDIPKISGCVLSNELLDNFAVHRVVMLNELMEVFVSYADGFAELLLPADEMLKNYLNELGVALPKGYCTEVNLQANEWIENVSDKLTAGFILTIDYGYTSEEFYAIKRSLGTLLCYSNHTINDYPYYNIGQQDITTHVNFSALKHWGLKVGLEFVGYTTQLNFLRGLGLANNIRLLEQKIIMSESQKEFLLNTFLREMGQKFKVLIQTKGLQKPYISGLSFCEDTL